MLKYIQKYRIALNIGFNYDTSHYITVYVYYSSFSLLLRITRFIRSRLFSILRHKLVMVMVRLTSLPKNQSHRPPKRHFNQFEINSKSSHILHINGKLMPLIWNTIVYHKTFSTHLLLLSLPWSTQFDYVVVVIQSFSYHSFSCVYKNIRNWWQNHVCSAIDEM